MLGICQIILAFLDFEPLFPENDQYSFCKHCREQLTQIQID